MGPILYLVPHLTYIYFPFTIAQPLTPVFMGASYLASLGHFLALNVSRSLARVHLPSIFVLTTTLLITTLLHSPAFNRSNPVVWVWLVVYGISPVAAGLLMVLNQRNRSRDAIPNGPTLPSYFGIVMNALAVVDALLGLALFLFPDQAGSLSAWELSPLTARVIGSWHLAGAALQAMLARQRTLRTARVGLAINVAASALLLIGALLHRGEFDGPFLSVAGYFLLLISLGGFSAFTLVHQARKT